MNAFKLPGDTDRISVVGHTGSGKTVFASWVLSWQPLDRKRWIVIDYKYDELLNSISKAQDLDVTVRKLPKKPGLYIVHPHPAEEEEVEKLLWKIWETGNTGLYIDEAHMIPNRSALKSLLTQGRSKRIPMIVVTQVPKWTSRFVFSEANYYSVFQLNDPEDRKRVRSFIREDLDEALPEYHSRYHDVKKNITFIMRPVPQIETIRDRIESRLKPNTWFS